jgi:hypothetical protein
MPKNKLIAALCGLVSLASISAPAAAAVVSGSITGGTVAGFGSFVNLDPVLAPFSVGKNDFNTLNLYAFTELQNYVLPSDMTVDIGTTPAKTIAAGTVINSHLIVFDPLALESVEGIVTFDGAVIGIDRKTSSLNSRHSLFGLPLVTYHSAIGSGLEGGEDFVVLGNPDANSVRINRFMADSPGDMIRVFTIGSVVPEPASWALMVVGFGIVGAGLRASRQRLVLA